MDPDSLPSSPGSEPPGPGSAPPASATAAPGSGSLQASLLDFALAELVRRHRESFPPLWTAESWAKLLIWMALNCGCRADAQAMEAFAVALGPVLPTRMRRLFFERELEELNLRLMADPAEPQVLALPLQVDHGEAGRPPALAPELVERALEQVGLRPHVAAQNRWRTLEAAVAIPWHSTAEGS